MRTTDQYSFSDQPGIAVFIAEGIEQAKSQEEFIAAWYLYDSGMTYASKDGTADAYKT